MNPLTRMELGTVVYSSPPFMIASIDSESCLFGGFLDVPVTEVCVFEGHSDAGVSEEARDQGDRHAVHHCVAGMSMPEIVKLDVLNAGLAAHQVPEPEVECA